MSNQTHTARSTSVTFLCLTGARTFSAIVQAVYLGSAARLLSTYEFGVLATATAAASVVIAIADLGNAPMLTKASARQQHLLVFNLVRLGRLSSFASGGIWLICMAVLPVDLLTKVSLSFLALYITSERLFETRAAVWVGSGRTWISATYLVGRRLLLIVAIAVSIEIRANTLLFQALIIAAPAAIVLVLEVGILLIHRKRSPTGKIGVLGLVGWSAWLNSLGMHGRQLDAPLLAATAGSLAVAGYAAISRLCNPLRQTWASLGSAILAFAAANPEANVRRFFQMLVLVSAVVAAGVMVFADQIVIVIFGSGFEAAGGILRWASPGFAASGVCGVYSSYLQARDLDLPVARASIFFGVLTLFLAVILGATVSMAAAAAGASAAYVANTLYLARLTRRETKGNGGR